MSARPGPAVFSTGEVLTTDCRPGAERENEEAQNEGRTRDFRNEYSESYSAVDQPEFATTRPHPVLPAWIARQNSADDNLEALCAPCHLREEAAYRMRTAWLKAAGRVGQMILPGLEAYNGRR